MKFMVLCDVMPSSLEDM